MKTVMLIGKTVTLFVAKRLLVIDVVSRLFQVKAENPEKDMLKVQPNKKLKDEKPEQELDKANTIKFGIGGSYISKSKVPLCLASEEKDYTKLKSNLERNLVKKADTD